MAGFDKVSDNGFRQSLCDTALRTSSSQGSSQKCVIGPLSETLPNESFALLAFRQSFRRSFQEPDPGTGATL